MRYKTTSYDLLKRLLASAPDGEACMEWPRSIKTGGYGTMRPQGRTRSVHRVAYELTYGPIPDGLDVCHKCDNPRCFRPSHLFAGTTAANMEDCLSKGRMRRSHGETHYAAKLTEAQAREIIRLGVLGWKQAELARKFEISKSVVAHIIHRRRWKHV